VVYITVSGIHNSKWYTLPHELLCDLLVYTQFENVSADRVTQPGGPRVEDPFSEAFVQNFKSVTSMVLV
jgi:hypothetical protein